jgi:hypothetical protein
MQTQLPSRKEVYVLAFEVSINGRRRYVAGHSDAQSLTLFLWGTTRHIQSASLNTSVAIPHDSPAGSATLSYETEPISIGDEVTIRVIDVEVPDMPAKRNDGDGSYQIQIESSG